MLFEADEPKPGTGGEVTLFANDRSIGAGRMPRTVPVAFSSYSGMDIGRDNGLVVDRDYETKAPYAFTGAVKVVFDLTPAHHEAEIDLHEHAAMQAVAPAPHSGGALLSVMSGGSVVRRASVP